MLLSSLSSLLIHKWWAAQCPLTSDACFIIFCQLLQSSTECITQFLQILHYLITLSICVDVPTYFCSFCRLPSISLDSYHWTLQRDVTFFQSAFACCSFSLWHMCSALGGDWKWWQNSKQKKIILQRTWLLQHLMMVPSSVMVDATDEARPSTALGLSRVELSQWAGRQTQRAERAIEQPRLVDQCRQLHTLPACLSLVISRFAASSSSSSAAAAAASKRSNCPWRSLLCRPALYRLYRWLQTFAHPAAARCVLRFWLIAFYVTNTRPSRPRDDQNLNEPKQNPKGPHRTT